MYTFVVVILPLFIDFGNDNFSQNSLLLCIYPLMSIDLICVNF